MTWPAISPTTIIRALVGFGVCALLAWALWPDTTPAVTPTQQQAAPLPPAVSEPPSVQVPGTEQPATPMAQAKPPIMAVPKTPKVRDKVKLPPAIFDAAETYIMATGKLQSRDDNSYTMTSVLDRRTGETQVYAVADPLPWFSLDISRGAAGIYYGLKDGQPVFRGALSQEVFRIKTVRARAVANLDSDGEWFAGVGAEVRW